MQVQFTPVFEGDEYHAPGFHVSEAGVIEVSDDRGQYLLKSQSKRFSAAHKSSSLAPSEPKEEPTTSKVEPTPESSKPEEVTEPVAKVETPKEDAESKPEVVQESKEKSKKGEK